MYGTSEDEVNQPVMAIKEMIKSGTGKEPELQINYVEIFTDVCIDISLR